MNLYDVMHNALEKGGEYVLGSAELKTHACYLVYGVLRSRERDREIRPGSGHEEIVCLVSGAVVLRSGNEGFTLKAGEAFHIKGETTLQMDNETDEEAVYVIAGGHSDTHHH